MAPASTLHIAEAKSNCRGHRHTPNETSNDPAQSGCPRPWQCAAHMTAPAGYQADVTLLSSRASAAEATSGPCCGLRGSRHALYPNTKATAHSGQPRRRQHTAHPRSDHQLVLRPSQASACSEPSSFASPRTCPTVCDAYIAYWWCVQCCYIDNVSFSNSCCCLREPRPVQSQIRKASHQANNHCGGKHATPRLSEQPRVLLLPAQASVCADPKNNKDAAQRCGPATRAELPSQVSACMRS